MELGLGNIESVGRADSATFNFVSKAELSTVQTLFNYFRNNPGFAGILLA